MTNKTMTLMIGKAELFADMHLKNPHVYCSYQGFSEIKKELETLKARNKLLEDGIDFYADIGNWFKESSAVPFRKITSDDIEENCGESGNSRIGGKLARQLQQSRIEG